MNSSMVCSSTGLTSVAHISATRDLSTQVRQGFIPCLIALHCSEKTLSIRFAQCACPCNTSLTVCRHINAILIYARPGSLSSCERCSCAVQGTLRVQARPAALHIENRVAIRFQRFGRKKQPFYRQASP